MTSKNETSAKVKGLSWCKDVPSLRTKKHAHTHTRTFNRKVHIRARNPFDEMKPLFHWTHPWFTMGYSFCYRRSFGGAWIWYGKTFWGWLFFFVDGVVEGWWDGGDAWSTILVMVGPHVWNVVPKRNGENFFDVCESEKILRWCLSILECVVIPIINRFNSNPS